MISVHRALDRELQNRFILTLLAKNQSSITKPAFHKFSEAAVEQTVILSWRQHSLVRPQPQYEHLHPRLPPGLRDGGALQVRGVRV